MSTSISSTSGSRSNNSSPKASMGDHWFKNRRPKEFQAQLVGKTGKRSRLRLGYDPLRDLLYIYFANPNQKAAKTVTVVPGVHADFSAEGKLIGLEIIAASEIVGKKIEFTLPEISRPAAKVLF